MPVINELIRKESDGTISFGNYELDTKSKLSDFEVNGDIYKVKTFKEITKLERNGMFVYESVPGTSVNGLKITNSGMNFNVEGTVDPQITLELEPETEYVIYIDGSNAGKMKTNIGGKLTLSVEVRSGQSTAIKIIKG